MLDWGGGFSEGDSGAHEWDGQGMRGLGVEV